MRDIPYSKVFKNLKDKFRLVEEVLKNSEDIKCICCGKNIHTIGISRVKDLCTDCAELVLSKDL